MSSDRSRVKRKRDKQEFIIKNARQGLMSAQDSEKKTDRQTDEETQENGVVIHRERERENDRPTNQRDETKR